MQAIAGRLEDDKLFSGDVKINGVSRDEAYAQGVYTNRMAVYVEQIDVHLAFLTVKVDLLAMVYRLLIVLVPYRKPFGLHWRTQFQLC